MVIKQVDFQLVFQILIYVVLPDTPRFYADSFIMQPHKTATI